MRCSRYSLQLQAEGRLVRWRSDEDLVKHRVRVIHWNTNESVERAIRLKKNGYEVASTVPEGMDFLRALRRNPPSDFGSTLGRLPDGAVLHEGTAAPADLTIWFVRTRGDLLAGIRKMAARTGPAPLWIAWPKKASGIQTDVSQQEIRERGLAAGLVDYKVSAIDATWSGLLFAKRK